jgi:uncharacterized protein YbjT (DUF2867 family)
MKVAVIGATGRTGRLVVDEARRQGHEVIACTRRPGLLADVDELTTIVEGDASDPATLRRALAEAVISTVPGGKRTHPHAAEEVTTAIVSAMREYDVARLVVTSAYPVVGDRPRLPMWILRRLLRTAYADVARMEQIVAGSNLDWTVARLNRLNDGPAAGALRASPELLDHPAPISRRDVATFLVGLLESPGAVRNALNVTTAARA